MAAPHLATMTPKLRLAPPLLLASMVSALTAGDLAQDRGRPDQIYVVTRTGAVKIVNGEVQTNGLEDVEYVDARGGEGKVASESVVRIVWGKVPQDFTDGVKYADRDLWEDASKKFLLAAGDASARDVVKAAARLRATEALLRWGATDRRQFGMAVDEARGFLSDYPDNREVPRARALEARALLLSGQAAEAGAVYRDVFAQYAADQISPGYDTMTCMRAGLHGARAMLIAKDTLAARELFAALDSTVGPMLAGLGPADPAAVELQAILDESLLGEGFAELAAGNTRPALTFFQNKLSNVNGSSSDTLRSVARLGLGEALLAEKKYREAQLQFARVSALDHTDRDRVARALLLMAECAQNILDEKFKARACGWLKAIRMDYGDTPSAAQANETETRLGCPD